MSLQLGGDGSRQASAPDDASRPAELLARLRAEITADEVLGPLAPLVQGWVTAALASDTGPASILSIVDRFVACYMRAIGVNQDPFVAAAVKRALRERGNAHA